VEKDTIMVVGAEEALLFCSHFCLPLTYRVTTCLENVEMSGNVLLSEFGKSWGIV